MTGMVLWRAARCADEPRPQRVACAHGVPATRGLEEALEAKAAHPGALPLWGGTDVMVDLNFGRERPEAILDLTRVRELAEWEERDGALRVGAGVSYTRAIAELGERLPGLAAASRTVGSPQIRNRGTIGGNLGSSSPAGDALPPLYASGAEVELAATRGTRRVPIGRVHHRPEAQRARARRADRRRSTSRRPRARSSSPRSAPATRW